MDIKNAGAVLLIYGGVATIRARIFMSLMEIYQYQRRRKSPIAGRVLMQKLKRHNAAFVSENGVV
ncbi:MAG: hypothetical protein CMF69_04610 [Magnetovibrio sp.]|nr:hypothetical protein [Magnetovibrio sp.]